MGKQILARCLLLVLAAPIILNISTCGNTSSSGGGSSGYNIKASVAYPDGSTSTASFAMSLSGAAASTAYTDSTGYCTFAGMGNGSYIVAPASLSSYTFSPSSLSVSVNNADANAGRFTMRKIISQSLLDSDVVWAVNNGINDIYNLNVAHHSGGNQNISTTCPVSGTVKITGTASGNSSTGITTVDLTYVMSACKVSESVNSGSYPITVTTAMTGTLTEKGSFNSSANYQTLNFQATGLALIGTEQKTKYADASFNETCDYSSKIAQNYSSSGQTDGSICGRSVSWTWGGSSGGSGGTGGTGGSGGTSGGGTGSGGSCTSSSVSCGGSLQCSQSVTIGSCSVQSCTCYTVINGSDSNFAWYKVNNSSYYCCDTNSGTTSCTTAAQQVANACGGTP